MRELGIGFVPYSPLGRGFLTGRDQDASTISTPTTSAGRNPRFQRRELRDRTSSSSSELEELAAEKGVTPSQLALAWVMAQGDDIVPIPGTKRRRYLEENAAARRIELTDDDLRGLDEAFPAGSTAGDRYPDMTRVNIEAPLA